MSKFVSKTIGQVMHEAASNYPEHDALIFPDRDLRENYATYHDKCVQVARGFLKLGIKKGEHVAIWATNIPEWAYIQFGLSMIGAVIVTVNTNYKANELEYVLNQSDATTLIHIENFRDNNYYEVVSELVGNMDTQEKGNITCEKLPKLKNIIYIGDREETPGMFKLEEIIKMGEEVSDEELEAREATLDPHDVINMQYTSGTTGFPKGVMLTHYNVINDARMFGERMNLCSTDKYIVHMPLFHCGGCVMGTLASAYYGACMVLLEQFNPLDALKAVHNYKCSVIGGVPTMYIAMLTHPDFDKFDLTSLRTGFMGGSPCPTKVMEQVLTVMHCPEMTIVFGTTETSPVIMQTKPDATLEERCGTVGKPYDDVEVKVVEPGTFNEVPVNTQGEIITKSECVMKGYYKMPEATAEAIKDGWYFTGDLGMVDENGNYKITGRSKDMIIRGGENIYPKELEEFLYKNPKVEDVQGCWHPRRKIW